MEIKTQNLNTTTTSSTTPKSQLPSNTKINQIASMSPSAQTPITTTNSLSSSTQCNNSSAGSNIQSVPIPTTNGASGFGIYKKNSLINAKLTILIFY